MSLVADLHLSAVVLALTGTALTADLSQGGAKPLGVMLGLLSALGYAIYVVLSAKVAGQAGPLASSTIILCSAGAMLGLVVLVQGPVFPTTATGWGAVVALALVSTVAAVLLFFVGLARIGPVNTSLVSTMEPLMAVVLGALFLDERLSARQVVGGLLILTASGWSLYGVIIGDLLVSAPNVIVLPCSILVLAKALRFQAAAEIAPALASC